MTNGPTRIASPTSVGVTPPSGGAKAPTATPPFAVIAWQPEQLEVKSFRPSACEPAAGSTAGILGPPNEPM